MILNRLHTDIRKLALYVSALVALLLGLEKLKEPVKILFNSDDRRLIWLVAAVPLIALVVFDILRIGIDWWLDQELRLKPGKSTTNAAGIFRITPYEDTAADRGSYERADNLQFAVLNWIQSAEFTIGYVTGRSGSGKSSLLNAFVLPQLRAQHPAVHAIVIRSFRDPVDELRLALQRIPDIAPQEIAGLRSSRKLLAAVCAYLKSRGERLVLIFDQFEEFLIIQNRNDARIKELQAIVDFIKESEFKNLLVLLVLRTEYAGQLEAFHLPALRQNQNWRDVSPFTEAAGREFLTKNGCLDIGETLMDALMRQAAEVEEMKGLIRPITLNMMGMILARTAEAEPRRKKNDADANRATLKVMRTRKRLNRLFLDYIQECVSLREIRVHVRPILKQMITTAGTKKPIDLEELTKLTGFHRDAVLGCLITLSGQGIVRRLDELENTWEVSHDFVARLLVHILGNWRSGVLAIFFKWVGPLALAVWIFSLLILFPEIQAWRTEVAIKDAYSTFKELNETIQQHPELSHLYANPVNYEKTRELVAQQIVALDAPGKAKFLISEKNFSQRIFDFFEKTLYQWEEAKLSHNPKAEQFLKEVLDYLTGRLLRNPRLLFYWYSEGGNLHVDYEDNTNHYYETHVLHDVAAPLTYKPDAIGPFQQR